jgi:hypothetical protein
MKNPENVAATLAISLLDFRSRHPVKAAFQTWPSRTHVEKLARTILDKDELPIEPYIPYVVHMIVRHFEGSATDRRLPIEEEVISWIRERGGIPALVLAYLASITGGP